MTKSTNLRIVVMGVAGSGKSTVAARLAEALGARLVEADDHHLMASITKMTAGTPLCDDDGGRGSCGCSASSRHLDPSCCRARRCGARIGTCSAASALSASHFSILTLSRPVHA